MAIDANANVADFIAERYDVELLRDVEGALDGTTTLKEAMPAVIVATMKSLRKRTVHGEFIGGDVLAVVEKAATAARLHFVLPPSDQPMISKQLTGAVLLEALRLDKDHAASLTVQDARERRAAEIVKESRVSITKVPQE